MKNTTLILFAFLISLTFFKESYAQAVTVNGKIVNGENKEAVPAASVLIKGSSKGTYSDSRGNFRLTVN